MATVVPAYNCGRFIARALASVRAQTYPPSEIIVVDDGSTDDTRSIVRGLGRDVLLVEQENRGPSAARNRGVAAASSDVIAFLDADDEWLPNAVETMVRVLVEQPEVALVTADKCAIDELGNVMRPSWFAAHGVATRVGAWKCRSVPNAVAELVKTNFVNTSVVVLRRDAFVDAGGFNPELRYGEDLELWVRIASRRPIVCLPQVLGRYRIHGGATTRATEPLLRGLIRMSEVIAERCGEVLAEQGGSSRELVANAYTNLGYWLFTQTRQDEARHTLARALSIRPTARALRYWCLSWLPPAVARSIRERKV